MFFWVLFFLLLIQFLSAETFEAAMWQKQNAELYIFHEPEGPNFMVADTDLLPAKYHYFKGNTIVALLCLVYQGELWCHLQHNTVRLN